MIYAIARMTIPSHKVDEVLEILSSVAQRTRCETGCINFKVYREVDLEDTIMVEETWKDEEDLVRHLRSNEYQKILLVAEMASAPPEIRFDTISRTTGVETVEKARAAAGNERL